MSEASPNLRYYLSLEFTASLARFGQLQIERSSVNTEEALAGGLGLGIRASGYYVPTPVVHLGLYLAGRDGDQQVQGVEPSGGMILTPVGETSTFSGGLTAKVGGHLSSRLWLGASLDVGFAVWRFDADFNTYAGFETFPALALELLPVKTSSFGIGLTMAVGVNVTPYIAVDASSSSGGVTKSASVHIVAVEPCIRMGVSFGR